MESVHSRVSRRQSFREASQFATSPLGKILRRANEHLDQIVVQTIVQLTLKCPLELWMVEVARMKFEGVSMNWNGRILEPNQDLHRVGLGPS